MTMADDPRTPPATGMRHLPTREGYDRWSASYDDSGNPMVALDGRTLPPLIGNVAGHCVVDLGCGTGRHAIRMATAGAAVTGIDASPGMLRQACARAGDLDVVFIEADLAAALPFGDAVFTLAVSSLVLEHLADLGHFFHEAHRVTRSGGRLAISAMHPEMYRRGVQARFDDPVTGEKTTMLSHDHSLNDMFAAAKGSGWSVDEVVEAAPDAALLRDFPDVIRYRNCPMLVAMALKKVSPKQ